MTWIEQEIAEQPQVIARLLTQRKQIATIAEAIRAADPAFVLLVARGTSDNAARYAQYIFGLLAGLPVALATPSLSTLYEATPNLSRAVVIGISQSGKSEDINAVLRDAAEQGALTVSMTNNAKSPMAKNAAHHLFLDAGEEKSIAATKSYTAQLTALAMLTAELAADEKLQSDLVRLPEWIERTLERSALIESWVERYRYMERFAVIGRGVNFATAFEMSLKIKELCYLSGEEYSEADFRHGPIAMIQSGFPVMLVMPNGKPFPLMLDLLQKLHERDAECLVITNRSEDCIPYTEKIMRIPDMPEWLSPIGAIIPGQVFAKSLAAARGHEVDRPRGLSKVTVTL